MSKKVYEIRVYPTNGGVLMKMGYHSQVDAEVIIKEDDKERLKVLIGERIVGCL
jgi:hypothetical protein